jgi:hypothetical protein
VIKMSLNTKNLALAGGILWGGVMFIFTLVALWTGYGTEFLNLVGTIYKGYSVSALGSIIGLIYGFVDSFIGLWIFGWIYNKLEERNG